MTTSTYDRTEMLDSYRLLAGSVFAGARWYSATATIRKNHSSPAGLRVSTVPA
ncbi:hypothetical protein [Amycolatopsis thermophila]|uniref:Uncharacterized protein n=1 Tax=Amycolatopsis thermophila TaxID=206084 RepID=A0ABU0EVK8_9PSEU|nr:hypothetical protein [Amycolatopsis thermophila]MDQ0379164.1 hypothetical protein [Amycolatopsis thermophila]